MAELKHLLVVTETREYWLRASDFDCSEPNEDGTFNVNLYVRNRRVGQFSCVIGVYISQAKPEFSSIKIEQPLNLHVPDDWG